MPLRRHKIGTEELILDLGLCHCLKPRPNENRVCLNCRGGVPKPDEAEYQNRLLEEEKRLVAPAKSDEVVCPHCQSLYFSIVMRMYPTGASVPNSNLLKCSGCNTIYDILDMKLVKRG